MRTPRLVASLALAGTMSCTAGLAAAQSYPSKPIRIVTAEAGGGLDFVARLVAQGLTTSLGHQVIVDNRGVLAGEIVAKSPPDGYTLLFYGNPIWLAPLLRDNVPYDPVADFAPITWATNSWDILVVHPSLPAKSVAELVALAKARPGMLNYSSGITGAATHLEGELFKSLARVNILRIPYKGNGPALIGLLGGQVDFTFANPGTVASHIKAGRLRALAFTSLQPSQLAPGLPTVAAALPGYESALNLGVFTPTKTPEAIRDRLNAEFVQYLRRTDVKERLFEAGFEVVASGPAQLAEKVKFEMAKWGKLINDAGMKEK